MYTKCNMYREQRRLSYAVCRHSSLWFRRARANNCLSSSSATVSKSQTITLSVELRCPSDLQCLSMVDGLEDVTLNMSFQGVPYDYRSWIYRIVDGRKLGLFLWSWVSVVW